jgi:very-short-patch-repair endonuclease
LATGPTAVASHRSAAWLWGLIDHPPPAPELTLPGRDQRGRRLRGVAARQSTDLDDRRTIVRRGIPCTDALRTLVDLGAVVRTRCLSDAVDRALATRLVTVAGLIAELGRVGRPGRTGVGTLRRVLTERGFVGAPEPSVLESKAQRLFRREGLPVPSFELVTGPEGEYRLDTASQALLLAIEFDGYACHFSPEHLQRDHVRRNRLQAQGWRCLIYTWCDVVRSPRRVACEIADMYAALSRAA